MDRIKRHFKNLPSQEQVATLMLKLGMSVHDGGAYCGPVLQSDTAVARAIDVDEDCNLIVIPEGETSPVTLNSGEVRVKLS